VVPAQVGPRPPIELPFGRSSNPARRRHSDIIAAFATATVERSRAVSTSAQRRQEPQTAVDEAPTEASPLEARIALPKTVARAASTLKFQHFFAVGQNQRLASRRRALTMPVQRAGASSAAAAPRQT
jgi:hypothetical protein